MTLETALEPQTQQVAPKLSTNRRLLLKGLAEGKSIAEAAVDARMLRTSAYRAIDDMREQLPQLMDGVGLDVRSILCRIREKMDAHETKFFAHEGVVRQRVDVEAHGVQLKALELAVSLRPELAKPEATHIGTVNVLFAGALPDWTDPGARGAGVGASPVPAHSGNGDTIVTTPPLSPLEGTGRGPGAVSHTNSANVDGTRCVNTANSVPVETVPVTGVPAKSKLSSRVVKRRQPRLPVYKP